MIRVDVPGREPRAGAAQRRVRAVRDATLGRAARAHRAAARPASHQQREY